MQKAEGRKETEEISPSIFEGVPEGRGSLYENNTDETLSSNGNLSRAG